MAKRKGRRKAPRHQSSVMERKTAGAMGRGEKPPPLAEKGVRPRYRRMRDRRLRGDMPDKRARNRAISREIGLLMGKRREQRALGEARAIDPLTGLHTRSHFMDELRTRKKIAAEAGRMQDRRKRHPARPLGVIYLDLNHFKELNDQKGHAAGDKALQDAADAIRKNVRTDDLAGRLGGDEFAVLVPGDVDEMKAVAQRVHDALGKRGLSASVGIAQFHPQECKNPLRAADRAMYKAKARHREGADKPTAVHGRH